MSSELIPVVLSKIMQSESYTVIILGDENKKFAIYTEPQVGRFLQIFLTQGKRQRPSTFDFLSNILKGGSIHPVQIVIENVENTTYFARLFLETISNEIKTVIEIDARPSDCIILALMNNTPIYCRKAMLEKAVPFIE
jgi:bifunctional DNase/RNase